MTVDALKSRYSASEDGFGFLESEDSDCDDKDVGSYLPEVQHKEKEPCFSKEEVLEMDDVLGLGK